MNMSIKEACIKIMKEWVKDKPIRQVDIVKEIVKLTGYSYESCRCNSFRNPNAIPEIHTKYKKVKHNGYTCYIEGESEYKQNYIKPEEYYQLLNFLNDSDKIITLSGTNSNCSKVLDNSKTLNIDYSPHSNGIKKNIFNIKEKASYNLDFEGILSIKKVNYINSLPYDKILLTFRSSKRDFLLEKINGNIIDSFNYKGKGGANMKSYLFSRCHNLTGDSLNK
jgi:hypothetical protein